MGRVKERAGEIGTGYKEPGTSKTSAHRIHSRTEDLRGQALAAIAAAGRAGLTADEVADRLGKTVLAIRPRVSELGDEGKIEKTGARRPNASGMLAAVWRAKT